MGTSINKLEIDLAEKEGCSVEEGSASVGQSLKCRVFALLEGLLKPVVGSNKRLLRWYTMQVVSVLII